MDFADFDNVFEFHSRAFRDIPKIDDNPLLISVILKRLFDYCPKSDYKSCRLVCRTWRDELQSKWRDQMWLVLAEDSNTTRLRQTELLELTNPVYSTEDPCQLISRPYRNVHAKIFSFTHVQIMYWCRTGPSLKKLHLDQTFIFDTDSFQRLLFKWTPNLGEFRFTCCNFTRPPDLIVRADAPTQRDNNNDANVLTNADKLLLTSPDRCIQRNLKTLSIVSHIRFMDNDTFPISWVVLFAHFQNVEKLGLKNFGKAMELIQILKIIAAIRQICGTNVLNIKEFDFGRLFQSTSFAPTVLFELRILSLPLTALTARLRKDVTHEDLGDLLEPNSATLSKLTIERRYDCDPYDTFRFKVFGNLTKFNLLGPMFATWDFLKFVPNLKELVVRNPQEMRLSSGESDAQRLWPVLEHLTMFEYTGAVIQHQVTRQLTGIMPNVTEVKLWVDAMSFDLVSKRWSKLRHATFGRLLVPEEKFARYIARLEDLRSLQLPKEIMTGFSDHVIYNGFLKLKRMEKISVLFSAVISDTALKLLDGAVWDTRDVRVDAPFRYFYPPCKKDLEDEDSDLDWND